MKQGSPPPLRLNSLQWKLIQILILKNQYSRLNALDETEERDLKIQIKYS